VYLMNTFMKTYEMSRHHGEHHFENSREQT